MTLNKENIMKKPLILITNSSNREEPMGEGARIIHCPYAYGAAIAAAGGIPVQTMEFAAEELADLCDGLLLSGGEDVDPARYGETILNDTVIADTRRDAYEFPLAKAFLDRGKPILAICRGFQVLNVVLGGDLWQDLPEQLGFIHSAIPASPRKDRSSVRSSAPSLRSTPPTTRPSAGWARA